jgi:hypothetical protein
VSIALAGFFVANVGCALEGDALGFARAATFGAGSLDEAFGEGGFAGDARKRDMLVENYHGRGDIAVCEAVISGIAARMPYKCSTAI